MGFSTCCSVLSQSSSRRTRAGRLSKVHYPSWLHSQGPSSQLASTTYSNMVFGKYVDKHGGSAKPEMRLPPMSELLGRVLPCNTDAPSRFSARGYYVPCWFPSVRTFTLSLRRGWRTDIFEQVGLGADGRPDRGSGLHRSELSSYFPGQSTYLKFSSY